MFVFLVSLTVLCVLVIAGIAAFMMDRSVNNNSER
jgi:hypothetical protein